MSVEDCLFCKIASGVIPASRVFEDDVCIAFNDISPQAPTHILIIPRQHIDSLDKAQAGDRDTLGQLLQAAANIARERGFADDGYRVVINTNADGGQTVFHLHVHLLGGRPFVFPPG
jgi:histidine triad (HIT) family protein